MKESGRTLVVLDDDPTGTQTVHGVEVLTNGSVEELSAALGRRPSCFYVLTNSRSMASDAAAALYRSIAENLSEASRNTGVAISVVTRSDSTLRGHFSEELEALDQGLGGGFDGRIVIPAFFEGGRYTIGDVHYVAEGDTLVPAAETEFAKDRAFGYGNSNLRRWIEEKTRGRVRASEVESISLDELRGPAGREAVLGRLLGLPKGAHLVVNAAAYPDLEVFVLALLEAEGAGKRYLFRTAAGFVRVRAGIEAQGLLPAATLFPQPGSGVLVVVGSYVGRTTAQLRPLVSLPQVTPIEVNVGNLANAQARTLEISKAGAAASRALDARRVAVIYTSRELESALGRAGELETGKAVSNALVDIVRSIPIRPRCIVAKGGITSCDVAIRSLGMRKAMVLGQAAPGVPVWELGPESAFPGLPYVVWPGNVGGPTALADLIRQA